MRTIDFIERVWSLVLGALGLALLVVVLLLVGAVVLIAWVAIRQARLSAATTLGSVGVMQGQPFLIVLTVPPTGATLRLRQRYTGRPSTSTRTRGIRYQATADLLIESGGMTERRLINVGTLEPRAGARERRGIASIENRSISRDGHGNRTYERTDLLQLRLAPGPIRIQGVIEVDCGRLDEGRLLVVV